MVRKDVKEAEKETKGEGAKVPKFERVRPNTAQAWNTIYSTIAIKVATLALLWISVRTFRDVDWRIGFVPNMIAAMIHGCSYTRSFMLFHDACHGSYFPKKIMNDRLASVTQWVISFPAWAWKKSHNHHHHVLGDLDGGDDSMTVYFARDELLEKPLWFQAAHRVIRDPFVFFVWVPIMLFWVYYPICYVRQPVAIYATYYFSNYDTTFLAYNFVAWYTGCLIGVMLFHVQHQANDPYRMSSKSSAWDRDEAAMKGSTYLLVPEYLKWVTLGIEYHHIHHWTTGVPCYGLRQAHESIPDSEWKSVGVNFLTMKNAFKTCFHTVYVDKTKQRFGSFWIYDRLGLTTEHDE